jgi:hypothetical protein
VGVYAYVLADNDKDDEDDEDDGDDNGGYEITMTR